MIHCGTVRQTAAIVAIGEKTTAEESAASSSKDKENAPDTTQSTDRVKKLVIRTGDRALVRFRFMQYPEFMKPGSRLLFREGRTKGVGKVVRMFT